MTAGVDLRPLRREHADRIVAALGLDDAIAAYLTLLAESDLELAEACELAIDLLDASDVNSSEWPRIREAIRAAMRRAGAEGVLDGVPPPPRLEDATPVVSATVPLGWDLRTGAPTPVVYAPTPAPSSSAPSSSAPSSSAPSSSAPSSPAPSSSAPSSPAPSSSAAELRDGSRARQDLGLDASGMVIAPFQRVTSADEG